MENKEYKFKLKDLFLEEDKKEKEGYIIGKVGGFGLELFGLYNFGIGCMDKDLWHAGAGIFAYFVGRFVGWSNERLSISRKFKRLEEKIKGGEK